MLRHGVNLLRNAMDRTVDRRLEAADPYFRFKAVLERLLGREGDRVRSGAVVCPRGPTSTGNARAAFLDAGVAWPAMSGASAAGED